MKFWKIASAALVCFSLALGTEGQVTNKKSLTLDGAVIAIDAAVAQAHKNKAGGVIAVVDEGGNLMALKRVDGMYLCARSGLYTMRVGVEAVRP
ncbi:MAG: heme-binding protein [Bryobacteraceae bacterium]